MCKEKHGPHSPRAAPGLQHISRLPYVHYHWTVHGPPASTNLCPQPAGLQSSVPNIGSPTDEGNLGLRELWTPKGSSVRVGKKEQNLPGAITQMIQEQQYVTLLNLTQ